MATAYTATNIGNSIEALSDKIGAISEQLKRRIWDDVYNNYGAIAFPEYSPSRVRVTPGGSKMLLDGMHTHPYGHINDPNQFLRPLTIGLDQALDGLDMNNPLRPKIEKLLSYCKTIAFTSTVPVF